MRIGDPARRRGIADADIWHAARTAVRRIVMDEDSTMLTGPAHDGALLEIGGLDLEGDDPVIVHAMALRPKFYRILGRELTTMRHTDDEIDSAARRFERLADDLDPATAAVDHTDDRGGGPHRRPPSDGCSLRGGALRRSPVAGRR